MGPHSRSLSCDDDTRVSAGCRQLGFFPVVSAEDLRQPAEVPRRLPESPLKRLLSVPNLVPRPALPKLTIRTKPMRRTFSEAAVLSQNCSPLLSERCSELSSSSSEPICIPSFRCPHGQLSTPGHVSWQRPSALALLDEAGKESERYPPQVAVPASRGSDSGGRRRAQRSPHSRAKACRGSTA